MTFHWILLFTACFLAAGNPGEEEDNPELLANAAVFELLGNIGALQRDGDDAFSIISYALENCLDAMKNWHFLVRACNEGKVYAYHKTSVTEEILITRELSDVHLTGCRFLIPEETTVGQGDAMTFLNDVGLAMVKKSKYKMMMKKDEKDEGMKALLLLALECIKNQSNHNVVLSNWQLVVSVCQVVTMRIKNKTTPAAVACNALQVPTLFGDMDDQSDQDDQSIKGQSDMKSRRLPPRKAAEKMKKELRKLIESEAI